MQPTAFAACLAFTFEQEGGFVENPADPGGATNLGITIGTLSDWLGRKATAADVRALTPLAAEPIYRSRYWDVVRGDDLPAGIALSIFDMAVNAGPRRAVEQLQAAVQTALDGAMGPLTLAAVARASPLKLISDLADAQEAYYRGLPTFGIFGRGWLNRCAARRAAAVAMLNRPAIPASVAPPEPGFWTRVAGLLRKAS